jgi:hypothetical protein
VEFGHENELEIDLFDDFYFDDGAHRYSDAEMVRFKKKNMSNLSATFTIRYK